MTFEAENHDDLMDQCAGFDWDFADELEEYSDAYTIEELDCE